MPHQTKNGSLSLLYTGSISVRRNGPTSNGYERWNTPPLHPSSSPQGAWALKKQACTSLIAHTEIGLYIQQHPVLTKMLLNICTSSFRHSGSQKIQILSGPCREIANGSSTPTVTSETIYIYILFYLNPMPP